MQKHQNDLVKRRALTGVPTVVVNGKYRIEASMVDNSNANMLRVADFLINRERRLIASKNLSAD